MKDAVALLMKMGYTFHQAVSIENAWLWAELQKYKEKEAKR